MTVAVAVERNGDAGACCWGREPVRGRWRGEESALSLDHQMLLLVASAVVVVAVIAVLVLCLLLARKLGGRCDARGVLVVQSPHLLLFLLDVLSLLLLEILLLLLLLLLLMLDKVDLL